MNAVGNVQNIISKRDAMNTKGKALDNKLAAIQAYRQRQVS